MLIVEAGRSINSIIRFVLNRKNVIVFPCFPLIWLLNINSSHLFQFQVSLDMFSSKYERGGATYDNFMFNNFVFCAPYSTIQCGMGFFCLNHHDVAGFTQI